MSFCPSCGTSLTPGTAHCTSCKTAAAAPGIAAPVAIAAAPSSSTSGLNSNAVIFLLMIALCIPCIAQNQAAIIVLENDWQWLGAPLLIPAAFVAGSAAKECPNSIFGDSNR